MTEEQDRQRGPRPWGARDASVSRGSGDHIDATEKQTPRSSSDGEGNGVREEEAEQSRADTGVGSVGTAAPKGSGLRVLLKEPRA